MNNIKKNIARIRHRKVKEFKRTASKRKPLRSKRFLKSFRKPLRRRIKADTTEDEIIRAFKEYLNVDVILEEESPYGYGWKYVSESPADNDESEWLVFKDPEDAENEALADVKERLEEEPTNFNMDFLQNHIYITDIDRKIIAGDDSDYLREEYEEEDLSEDEIEKKIEEKYDEIYKALEDPIEYFVEDQGIYSIEDLMQQNFIHIDEREAAQDAIDIDGVAHFLDYYDGEEEEIEDPETKNDFLAYGTN